MRRVDRDESIETSRSKQSIETGQREVDPRVERGNRQMAVFDLLIRGGTVIDGTQAPRFDADVGVLRRPHRRRRRPRRRERRRTIDAGRPDRRPRLHRLAHPRRPGPAGASGHGPKVSQGVTTVIAGNCGISAAPLVRGMKLPMPLDLIDVGGRAVPHPTFASWVSGAGARRLRPTSRRWSATRRCGAAPWPSRPGGRRRGDRGGCRRCSSKRSMPARSALDGHVLPAGAEGDAPRRDRRGRAGRSARRPLRAPTCATRRRR